jgi:hypothetical protein
MNGQPEALRLAEWIEGDMTCQGDAEIAAELRRHRQGGRRGEMSEQHQCVGQVFGAGNYFGRMCGRTAKYEHNGKWYCKMHHPPTVKQKQDEKRAAFEREWAAQRAANKRAEAARAETKRRAELFPELLEALQAMLRMTERHATPGLIAAPGSPVALARAAIARAEGEKT